MIKTITQPNGNFYTGETKNGDIRHGKGTFCFADGKFYEGMWVDGKKCGQGTMKQPDGKIAEGMWANGKQNGLGKLTLPNGTIYEGMFVDD
jgi:hypothetical protein